MGVLRPKKKKSTSLKCFKAYKGDSESIVDALEAIGAKSDFSYRKKIAAKNKIKDYKGTPEQNEKMLALLKKGKLVKP